MATPLRLFPRPQGPNCPPCPLLLVCGSDRTDNACSVDFDPDGPAGPFALHPLRTDFDEHFARVGGAGLDDIVGHALQAPPLGSYLHQIKWLARLRRDPSKEMVSSVAVRVKEVFRSRRVRSAAEVRAKTGLAADVPVVLLLHGDDALLERLDEADVAAAVAAAGYALVTSPSFSLWEPRRRPDNLLSLRRSFLCYEELADAGANVCPRVGWVERRDVERLAKWVSRHSITLVSLDLMTYDGRSFDRAVARLAEFDALTGGLCHYLVDGVRARGKIEALYVAAAADRVTVSNATMTGPPPLTDGVADDTLLGRGAVTVARCAEAREAVAAAHASSVESFIATACEEAERLEALGDRAVEPASAEATGPDGG